MNFSRPYYFVMLGHRLTIRVNPQLVSDYTDTRWAVTAASLERARAGPWPALTTPLVKMREPFVIPQDLFPAAIPIEQDHRYRDISEVIDAFNGVGALEDTGWFKRLQASLDAQGSARHKSVRMRTRDDIHIFFNGYVHDFVTSLRDKGYDPRKGRELGFAHINHKGEITKSSSACHRFFTARKLGLTAFPLYIYGIHADWHATVLAASQRKGSGALRDAIDAIAECHAAR
jgi:hypothetical protein